MKSSLSGDSIMEGLSATDLQIFREKSRAFIGSVKIPLDKLRHAGCVNFLSNLSTARGHLRQRFTGLTLEFLRIVGVVSRAVLPISFVYAAGLSMAYHVDILSAKIVF
jgi:hypothetical protein